jgi:ABC-2 type transport system permease protein
VPTASMPTGLRWFAEHQPFTPVINAVRDLLLARPAGDNVIVAIGWSVGIGLVGYLWARRLYNRDPVPA